MNSIAGSQGRTFLELLEELLGQIPGNRTLPAWIQTRLAKEKRFGSRDRRLYRELLYTAVRFYPWVIELRQTRPDEVLDSIIWLAAPLPALKAMKDRLPPTLGPEVESIAEKATRLGVTAALYPSWVSEQAPELTRSPNLEVIHRRAPLWLRLHAEQPNAVFDEFRQLGWEWKLSEQVSGAVEVFGDVDVTKTTAFEKGWIEIQDIGSQRILLSSPIKPGERWLDACAGAGGKTLQLATLLGPKGHVVAHDIRADALAELSIRAKRAGLQNVDVTTAPTGDFDGVLVDAPCTGSGTWRRSPHLKWTTDESQLQRASLLQSTLLAKFSRFVRPGGLLVYATCSVARSENEDVVTAFLEKHLAFGKHLKSGTHTGHLSAASGELLLPADHNGDGFYVAVLQRRA